MFDYLRIIIMLGLVGCLAGTNALGQNNDATQGTGKASSKSRNKTAATQSSKDLVQSVTTDPTFSTLAAALKQANLVATLSKPGPFTVFAPDNEAFKALPAGTLENLLRDQNKETLASILKFHVVPGRITMADLEDGQKLKTVNGEELSVTKLNGKVAVNGVEIDQPDVAASNGVIHIVGQVLLPPRQGMVGDQHK